MKKLIVGLLAVLLLFGGFTAWNQRNNPTPPPASAPAAVAPSFDAASAPAPSLPEVHSLDYDALRGLYPGDSAAVTVEGQSLSWAEYADWLRTNGKQYEDYFTQMGMYYGVAADWAGSIGDGTGLNYAQGLLRETNESLASYLAIRALAAEKGVTLDDEARAKLEPEAMAADICGEGATIEQLAERLEQSSYISVDAFRFYSETVALYGALGTELCGAEGEKLSEEQVIDELEAKGYLSAGHILFMTIDPMTGQSLDAETIAAKRAQAEAVTEELRAIEDPAERLKRFAELKAQYCEDTGKMLYPDGYTFTPGTMVTEFEDAVRAMESYDVSEPVQSTYGLHVIMRLPLQGESLLYSAQGTPKTARKSIANTVVSDTLDAYIEAHPPVYAEGLGELDLTKFILP